MLLSQLVLLISTLWLTLPRSPVHNTPCPLHWVRDKHDQSFCELKRLNISNNQVPGEGVKYLTTALTHINYKLNTLNLASNQVTDKGVKHLTTAITNSNCKHNYEEIKPCFEQDNG